jgi:hypothetical protein
MTDAIMDGRNRPTAYLANAMLALRSAPELKDTLAYDQMIMSAMLMRGLPECGSEYAVDETRLPLPVTDADVTIVQEWLQRSGMPKMPKDTVFQAVDLRAEAYPRVSID